MLKKWLEKQMAATEQRLYHKLKGYIDSRLKEKSSDLVKLPIFTLEDIANMAKFEKTLSITSNETKVIDFPTAERVEEPKKKRKNKGGWSQKTHERKGHYRTYADGKKVWVKGSKVNADKD